MFEASSVFILSYDRDNDGNEKIYKLELEREAQCAVCKAFESSVNSMVSGKNIHDFEVNYKLEDDEIFQIKSIQLPDSIKEAIREPIGVDSFKKIKKKPDGEEHDNGDKDNMGFPSIKAIFVGERIQIDGVEHFQIGFQRYRKEQNMALLPFRFFFTKETFIIEKNFGIGITDQLDCFYTVNDLQFISYYFAKQIFNLKEYYRSATDTDVKTFTDNKSLIFADADSFVNMANTYVRRKIARINDSKVLEDYEIKDIKELADKSKINIEIQDNRILIPADKDRALEVLAFLDEEAYLGPFSEDVLIANSKRVLRKNKETVSSGRK